MGMRFVVIILCAAMLAGCSIAVLPKHIPPAGSDAVDFSGAVIMIANAEQDAGEYAVRDDKGGKTPIIVNRMKWSKKLVESLAGELARRGARVRSNPNVTLNISIPEIAFSQFGDIYQFKVTAGVAASTGWSRQYDGIAETTPGVVESSAGTAERLAGDALAKVIKAMLRDEDFAAVVRTQAEQSQKSREGAPAVQTR